MDFFYFFNTELFVVCCLTCVKTCDVEESVFVECYGLLLITMASA